MKWHRVALAAVTFATAACARDRPPDIEHGILLLAEGRHLARRHGETLARAGRSDQIRRLADWADAFADGVGLATDQRADAISLRALVQPTVR